MAPHQILSWHLSYWLYNRATGTDDVDRCFCNLDLVITSCFRLRQWKGSPTMQNNGKPELFSRFVFCFFLVRNNTFDTIYEWQGYDVGCFQSVCVFCQNIIKGKAVSENALSDLCFVIGYQCEIQSSLRIEFLIELGMFEISSFINVKDTCQFGKIQVVRPIFRDPSHSFNKGCGLGSICQVPMDQIPSSCSHNQQRYSFTVW